MQPLRESTDMVRICRVRTVGGLFLAYGIELYALEL